jgi:hypothetical protein
LQLWHHQPISRDALDAVFASRFRSDEQRSSAAAISAAAIAVGSAQINRLV